MAEAAAQGFHGRLLRAHEEERARLARELHDDVTQRLARLAIDAGQVERAPSAATVGETMAGVREGLVRLSEDIHALSYRLHPSILEDLGLVAALKAECERFTRQESIPVDVKVGEMPAVVTARDGPLPLSRGAGGVAQRRGVTLRHARWTSPCGAWMAGCNWRCATTASGLIPRVRERGHTLAWRACSERVQLLGGELDIESAPGQGTTVLAWVPLREDP